MTRDDLIKIFDVVDDDIRNFAIDTIDEYIFFQEQLNKLKKLPLIRLNPKRPEIQEITPAGKLIKDYSNIMDAKRATLLRILYKVESSAAEELLAKLSEFE